MNHSFFPFAGNDNVTVIIIQYTSRQCTDCKNLSAYDQNRWDKI